MSLSEQHILYFKLHPRLPHFEYNMLAKDRVTQLYATWRTAVTRAYLIPPRPSTIYKIQKFRNRVDHLHRRRFLKAFAKKHPLPKQKGSYWEFGAAQDYLKCNSSNLQHHFVASYRYSRYWRQHIPKLP